MASAWEQFQQNIITHFDNNTFVKMTLSQYKGKEELRNIYIKKIAIKAKPMLSFTYRFQRRDIVKNFSIEDAIVELQHYLNSQQFCNAVLFTLENDIELSIKSKDNAVIKQRKASQTQLLPQTHDKQKQRKITDLEKPYLHALQITDADGKVYKNAQDKYKQINHFIEILSTMLNELESEDTLKVADMGSGKGYLTFALYDYLNNSLNKKAAVTGVEYRQDMVDLCNQIAAQSKFEHLQFVKGAIENYEANGLDMLIALHACDTATDDAIAKGINNNASLIVVAPCCHKQIRKAMSQGKPNADMDFLLKYGLFFERQAEMLTDSMRLLILNYFGYQTKVVDFVSDQHTPKNVMLIAKKTKGNTTFNQTEIKEKLQEIKQYWGIEKHYLEQLMDV